MHIRPLLPLALLFLASCGPTPEDRKNLADAYASYNRHDFPATESAAGAYIQKQPTADNVDEAFYLRGLARYSRGNRIEAAADLQKAIDRSKRSDLKFKAWITLGDIAFDQNHWDDAAANYEKALAANPGAAVEPRMQFRLGVALQSVGQWDNARTHLALVAASTDPLLASRARDRLAFHAFALQFGAFKEGPRAGELVRQLRAAAINANAYTETHNGQLAYYVRSGTYTTLADAENARKHLLPKFPATVVVP